MSKKKTTKNSPPLTNATHTSSIPPVPPRDPLIDFTVPKVENNLPLGAPFGAFSGFPENQGSPYSEQISQVTTLFKNLRWYLISNFRQPLSEAYVEFGLVQAITDIPVDDALRGGFEIKSKQLDEAQVEQLHIALDRDDDIQTLGQAAKWTRLFGGGGIIVLTGGQDPETPLDLERLTGDSELEFRSADLWELTWTLNNADIYSPSMNYDPYTPVEESEFYDYYGVKVHRSRVMKMIGLQAPSFIRPRLRGWGFSEVERLIRSINQYLKATDLTFEVLDEFKLDIFKMKNLINTLQSPQGKQAVAERVRYANWQKNYQNALVMDSEDDFDHKQLSFAGLAEVMAGIRMQIASDMRMPMSKLFGISATGFNSGEDDLEVYNAMVESQVRSKIKYPALRMCEIKCQMLFGFIPDDLSIHFKPLRVMSAEQEENVKTQKFARLLQMRQAGELTTLELRDACNRGKLLDITLDTSQDSLNPEDPEIEGVVEEGENNPKDPQDTDNPGVDQAGTKKPQASQKGGQGQGNVKPPKDSPEPRESKTPDPKDAKDTKDPKDLKNDVSRVQPYNRTQRITRVLFRNSIDYDMAAYEVDGGDNQFDPGRAPFFEDPKSVDIPLWERAKQSSLKAYGKVKWQFVLWWYLKEGGKMHA